MINGLLKFSNYFRNNRINQGNLPYLLLNAAALSATIFTYCVIFWTANKGFNFTDESLYLFMSHYPEDVSFSFTFFYWYSHYLFKLVNYNIVTMREISILLYMISVIIFAYGS